MKTPGFKRWFRLGALHPYNMDEKTVHERVKERQALHELIRLGKGGLV